jgi:hypothetical protein
MAVYCISYDLKSNNYDSLIEAIKTYGVWWHQSESTWFIESNHTAKQILDYLINFLEKNDKLIVIQVQRNWWAIGHTEIEYNWLKQRNF